MRNGAMLVQTIGALMMVAPITINEVDSKQPRKTTLCLFGFSSIKKF